MGVRIQKEACALVLQVEDKGFKTPSDYPESSRRRTGLTQNRISMNLHAHQKQLAVRYAASSCGGPEAGICVFVVIIVGVCLPVLFGG